MTGRRRAATPIGSPEVALPDLHAGAPGDVRAGQDCDGLRFEALAWEDLQADRVTVLECRFSGCRLDGARLRRARMSSCVLEDVSATSLDVSDSAWFEVVVRGGRIGALIACGANLAHVTFAGLRADYVNLRGADLDRVLLRGCRIGELDLGTARLQAVRFDECDIDRLVLTGASLQGVDLSGADFSALDGVSALTGATISQVQLVRLAPAIAAEHGISVVDTAQP